MAINVSSNFLRNLIVSWIDKISSSKLADFDFVSKNEWVSQDVSVSLSPSKELFIYIDITNITSEYYSAVYTSGQLLIFFNKAYKRELDQLRQISFKNNLDMMFKLCINNTFYLVT